MYLCAFQRSRHQVLRDYCPNIYCGWHVSNSSVLCRCNTKELGIGLVKRRGEERSEIIGWFLCPIKTRDLFSTALPIWKKRQKGIPWHCTLLPSKFFYPKWEIWYVLKVWKSVIGLHIYFVMCVQLLFSILDCSSKKNQWFWNYIKTKESSLTQQ